MGGLFRRLVNGVAIASLILSSACGTVTTKPINNLGVSPSIYTAFCLDKLASFQPFIPEKPEIISEKPGVCLYKNIEGLEDNVIGSLSPQNGFVGVLEVRNGWAKIAENQWVPTYALDLLAGKESKDGYFTDVPITDFVFVFNEPGQAE